MNNKRQRGHTVTKKLSARIASPSGASWTLWGPAITFWCLNSSFLLAASGTQGNLLLAVAANILPAGILVAFILGWQSVTAHLHHIPAVVVFVVGAALGATKGISTYLALWTLSGSQAPLPGFAENTVSAAFIGLWLLPVMGVVGSILKDFDAERELLVSETVALRLGSNIERQLDNNVAEFVAQARHQLTLSAGSTEKLKTALIDLAHSDARATSHRLWEQASARIGTFRLRDLLIATIREHRFPATLSSAAIFLSLYASQVSFLGPAEALLRSFIQSAVVFTVFLLGRFIPTRRRVSSVIVFFAVPACATAVIDVLGRLVFTPNPTVNTWVADTMIFVALSVNALIFGIFFMARRTHEEIRAELQHMSSERMDSEANEVVRLIRSREAAELLHGYVQNQLLAAAARVGNQPENAESITKIIEKMLDQLEQGALLGDSAEPAGVHALAEATVELWRGVIQVELSMHDNETWRSTELGLIDRIINELVGNAHRHGLATSITIDVRLEPTLINVIAEDNGTGPRNGSPGLGSALLTASTQGHWSRAARTQGTGTIVRASIARSGTH